MKARTLRSCVFGGFAVAFALSAVNLNLSRATELHPSFPLLDTQGMKVLDSLEPVSPIRTCGQCHDTDIILETNTHATIGAGVWNPFDPSKTKALESAEDEAGAANCFLCHIAQPNDSARRAALVAGQPEWAATATLAGSGVVESRDDASEPASLLAFSLQETAWRYRPEGFTSDGHVRADWLGIQDPSSASCGSCHGLVELDPDRPLAWPVRTSTGAPWTTLRTGDVFAGQWIRDSGLNLAEKESLFRPWDVHAARNLECVDCHHSETNPVYRRASAERPAHLRFDARRIEMGDYLKRPSHALAHAADSGMRDCATCHDPAQGHDWLPYLDRHIDVLSCTACHTPTLYAPSARLVDWSFPDSSGQPRIEWRGVLPQSQEQFGFDFAEASAHTYLTGYSPTLLPRRSVDGKERLAPHTLSTTVAWVSGPDATPVPPELARAAFYTSEGTLHPSLRGRFDTDGDGACSPAEARLDRPEKIEAAQARLTAAGLEFPRLVSRVEPQVVAHGVVGDIWALRDCQQCHGDESRIGAPEMLAATLPLETTPTLGSSERSRLEGSVESMVGGGARMLPAPQDELYVLGRDGERGTRRLGLAIVGLTALGIGVHGGLRRIHARKPQNVTHDQTVAAGAPVYMYRTYERVWHWLQAVAVFLLFLTGLEIHFAGAVPGIGFATAVQVHNVIAFLVVVNAALAAFYHMVSGEIRQFLPEPRGFFRGTVLQLRHYVYGIFRGEPHPYQKRPDQKLNVLQQTTYLVILNVLFPLQIGTGVLIWGVQRWPSVDAALGGLSLLGPVHNLGAWLFAAFILVHVYLTTTGPTPSTYVRAMVTGWEEHS